MLREELQLLQEPGSYVGEVVKVMGKNKVLVKVNPSFVSFFFNFAPLSLMLSNYIFIDVSPFGVEYTLIDLYL